jgi:hypothetical protein
MTKIVARLLPDTSKRAWRIWTETLIEGERPMPYLEWVATVLASQVSEGSRTLEAEGALDSRTTCPWATPLDQRAG